MKRPFLSILLVLLVVGVYAQKLSISIFNETSLTTILLTPTRGEYKLITGDVENIIRVNQIVYLTRVGDSISVRDANSNLGIWSRVSVVGQTGSDLIRVKPILPALAARMYDDNMSFYVEYNRVMAINIIDQEKYVAAVVETEGGYNRNPEFYKAQALIVRTYTYAHLQKHKDEGFNLCDCVHCQAYNGRSESDRIYEATYDTKDLIIVDNSSRPITAAFHANCGGETANSQDVWVSAEPYLVATPDRYCSGGHSASWEKRIPIKDWKVFLAAQGVDTSYLTNSELNFIQKTRQKYYMLKGEQIPTTKIRTHFKLRSAWFNVYAHKYDVRLTGKGYGHGVGLCQEGAISMAERGWSFEKIINYYYKGVQIVSIDKIKASDIYPDSTSTDEVVLY